MQHITHEQQKDRWELEHKNPTALVQMDSIDASSGVIKFIEWLKKQQYDLSQLKGLEICCGKGRNVIWLASLGIEMYGLDFSEAAIREATIRAKKAGVTDRLHFEVHDTIHPFPNDKNSLDFAIDCFGSTDIESASARRFTLDHTINALKPGGLIFVYLLSNDDEFHEAMIKKSPGPDQGSFLHPNTGKYEKVFSEDEVMFIYSHLNFLTLERIPKQATFYGKVYNCNHIWAVFQKPISDD